MADTRATRGDRCKPGAPLALDPAILQQVTHARAAGSGNWGVNLLDIDGPTRGRPAPAIEVSPADVTHFGNFGAQTVLHTPPAFLSPQEAVRFRLPRLLRAKILSGNWLPAPRSLRRTSPG